MSGPVSITVDPALPAPVPADVTIAPGPPAPPCGAACAVTWGDPHLVTFDGARFDAQSAGELIAAKSTTDDFEIQVRQQPWLGSRLVAVNVATAMTVSGHRVGVYLTNTGTRTLIDGNKPPRPPHQPHTGGGTITQDTANNFETIQLPDGSFVTAAYVPGSRHQPHHQLGRRSYRSNEGSARQRRPRLDQRPDQSRRSTAALPRIHANRHPHQIRQHMAHQPNRVTLRLRPRANN